MQNQNEFPSVAFVKVPRDKGTWKDARAGSQANTVTGQFRDLEQIPQLMALSVHTCTVNVIILATEQHCENLMRNVSKLSSILPGM